ncbi:MAG TPA: hypothetical protein GX747_04680 [Tenericutes bacterium]|nr:hypothetical protein [Mycoplasmatota bacterium]
MVDVIRETLYSNRNISDDVKDNLFELIIVFNERFPEVSLDNLNNRLMSLKIEKVSKYLRRTISYYDFRKNILYFNIEEIKKGYDMKHILMFELLNIITSTKHHTGFNLDNKFEALNVGFTEILANYLVGNNGDKFIYPDEAISANLISIIVGAENLHISYFNNDARYLMESFVKAGLKL